MIYTPHPYTVDFIRLLADNPAYGAFLPVGFGKTAIALTALDELLFDQCCVSRVLVIAPLRVARDTWPAEAEKWDHLKRLKVSKVIGDKAARLAALTAQANVFVINRENVPWLVANVRWNFDCVVIDELSSFKDHQSAGFKALRKVLPKIKRIYGLTATPASNGLIQLWSQIYLLDRGRRLGKGIGAYREKYFDEDKVNPRNGQVYSYKLKPFAEKEIYTELKDIVRSADQSLVPLPEKILTEHWVDLDAETKKKYKAMAKEYVIDWDTTAANAAVVVNKLQQIANGCVYRTDHSVLWLHNEKMQKVAELVEAANGNPVLIFYLYQFDFDALKLLYRDLLDMCDPAAVEKWNTGSVRVGAAHPKSAGHGLNLQYGGSIMIEIGVPWDLEQIIQMEGRLHRQGQTQMVNVHRVLTRDTIDETIVERLAGKHITQSDFLNSIRGEPI